MPNETISTIKSASASIILIPQFISSRLIRWCYEGGFHRLDHLAVDHHLYFYVGFISSDCTFVAHQKETRLRNPSLLQFRELIDELYGKTSFRWHQFKRHILVTFVDEFQAVEVADGAVIP